MSSLSGITHPDPRIQEKVRYLCDYFDASVKLFGQTPQFHPDNPELLLGELCFHLSTNVDQCFRYVDSILNHPLWNDVSVLGTFKNHSLFEVCRTGFIRLATHKAKRKWLAANSQSLLGKSKALHRDVNRWFLVKKVDELISYLGCRHDLSQHVDEMSECIRIIVSILILDSQHENDLLDLFKRIITRDPKTYPFPKRLANRPTAEKKRYLSELTFKEQFRSVRYIRQRPKRTEHFIFRCFGVRSPKEFSATFEDIQFLHGENVRFDRLKATLAKRERANDFFQTKDCLYAIVRTKHNSRDAGERIALAKVRDGVEYLKAQIGEGFHLDSSSYLTTSNFRDLGWRLSFNDGVTRVTKLELDKFALTPFVMLEKVTGHAKKDFLRHEKVFSRAAVSSLPSDYWIYGEVMLTGISTDKRIERLSQLSSIDQHVHALLQMAARIWTITSPMNTSRMMLGLSEERSDELYALGNDHLKMMDWIERNVNVPIVNRLIAYARGIQKMRPQDFVQDNERTWIRAYGQRNSIVHANELHEKTVAVCALLLPPYVQRLRRAIVSGIHSNPASDLGQTIASL